MPAEKCNYNVNLCNKKSVAKMREALGKSLGVPAEKIHLKAKTNEGVDAIGRGEAIAAHVVATLVARYLRGYLRGRSSRRT